MEALRLIQISLKASRQKQTGHRSDPYRGRCFPFFVKAGFAGDAGVGLMRYLNFDLNTHKVYTFCIYLCENR
jgi:hypothetical protein